MLLIPFFCNSVMCLTWWCSWLMMNHGHGLWKIHESYLQSSLNSLHFPVNRHLQLRKASRSTKFPQCMSLGKGQTKSFYFMQSYPVFPLQLTVSINQTSDFLVTLQQLYLLRLFSCRARVRGEGLQGGKSNPHLQGESAISQPTELLRFPIRCSEMLNTWMFYFGLIFCTLH